MAVLRRATTRERLARWLLFAASMSLAGCMVLDAIRGREPSFDFSHRLHVVEQGFDCGDCHMTVEDADEPGMPVPMQCMLCHEEIDREKPPERTVASLFVAGTYAGRRVSALPSEVVFSHLGHVETGMGCAACHGDVEASDRVLPEVWVSMDDCMACHAKRRVANDCSTCHLEIRSDLPPATHDQHWLEVHGGVARGRSREALDRCSLCHTEQNCTTCHQTMAPRDHTNFWRRRGHAFGAALDRNRCAACHQPDSCNRCHAEVLPVSHVGSWGGTKSTHCLSCHLPLQSQGCFTCHKDAKSHLLAPPMPPDHVPGMDCRQCHGLTAPLLHVDNGTDCLACHK